MNFSTKQSNGDFPGVYDIDPQEVWQQRDNILVVDVRRPDEFTGELGHIPGATHIVLDILPQQIDNIPTDRPIIFACRSGQRSARAAQFAQGHGIKEVYNMKGGMLLWNQVGLAVEGRSEG